VTAPSPCYAFTVKRDPRDAQPHAVLLLVLRPRISNNVGSYLTPSNNWMLIIRYWNRMLITSAKEGGYVFGAICLSVCLSVCRITRKLVNGF